MNELLVQVLCHCQYTYFVIGGIPKFGHISAFIRDSLHWLPIQQRVQFKTISLMRNCLTGVAPSYLRSACVLVSSLPARASLRSSSHGLLIVPLMRSATAQSRSFAYAGPSAWNSLPHALRLELLALPLLSSVDVSRLSYLLAPVR